MKSKIYLTGRISFLLAAMLALPTTVAYSRRRPARQTTRPVTSAIDYSKFSHATKKHQAACNTCHKAPTKNWKTAAAYPDVADYPEHEACVSCHRSQFFKGPKPAICAVCHSKTSPRDDARFVFRNSASQRQFSIEFPHDLHQDVIALLESSSSASRSLSLNHVVSRSLDAQGNGQNYNNCSICHPQQTSLKAPVVGWADNFVPQAATFKSAPASHASCFNCHWKSQPPVADSCAGCHKLETPHAASEAPVRISLKFMHEGGGEKKNHIAECTSCHINITKAASLRGLKPDVPITSCTECHNREGLRQDVSKELLAIDKDRTFVCIYCHTSNVGRLDPPASHYLIAERPPLTRKDIK